MMKEKMMKEGRHERMKEEKQMNDNRKVVDNHKEGIKRVMQRKGDMMAGQGGKMGVNLEKADWKRSDTKLTPREA